MRSQSKGDEYMLLVQKIKRSISKQENYFQKTKEGVVVMLYSPWLHTMSDQKLCKHVTVTPM